MLASPETPVSETPVKTGRIFVRRGTPEDIGWLVDQLKDFSLFYGTKRPLYTSEDFARKGLEKIINEHLLIIAEKDGVGPVGFIAGLFVPHVFNPDIFVLNEAFWWVPELYRGTRAGALLLREFVAWGKKEADWILFTLENESPVNETALLRHGFTFKERSYLLEV